MRSTISELAATDIIDSVLKNSNSQSLGIIFDFVVNSETSKIEYYILEPSGFFDLERKLLAVPSDVVSYTREYGFTLDVDTDSFDLEEAPSFHEDNWPNIADPSFKKEVKSFYSAFLN